MLNTLVLPSDFIAVPEYICVTELCVIKHAFAFLYRP